METVAIPDDLWAEIEKTTNNMEAARCGLEHFAHTLRECHKSLWRMIGTELPQTEAFEWRLDMDARVLVKLRPK